MLDMSALGHFQIFGSYSEDARFDQPQFQTGPIGVRVQHGPKVPPL